jgi:hypothetical protein
MHALSRPVALAVALIASAALGACSSNDAGTAAPTSTAPSTATTVDPVAAKEAFLADGNAICKAMNEEAAALAAAYGPDGPTNASEASELLLANADLIDRAVTDLRALPQPPGDEAQLDAMYTKVGELTTITRTVAAAFAAGDTANAEQQIATEGKAASSAANTASTDYGLVECAKT